MEIECSCRSSPGTGVGRRSSAYMERDLFLMYISMQESFRFARGFCAARTGSTAGTPHFSHVQVQRAYTHGRVLLYMVLMVLIAHTCSSYNELMRALMRCSCTTHDRS